jgi:hypothetical protein
MALDFPSSPNPGATYTASGVIWVWDGAKWEPSVIASGPFVPLSGATMVGPLILSEDPQVPLEAATKEYVDTGDIATAASVPANYPLNSNRIINGDMWIDQRNNGAATNTGYAVDRWQIASNQAGKLQFQRITSGANFLFPYCINCQSLSAYASLAADAFTVLQVIEANMISDFAWGTSDALPITLSFWARSTSNTGIFSGAIQNQPNPPTRSYPFTFSIPTVATWYKFSITIPGDTVGSWVLGGNAGGLRLCFDLGSGSTYRGPANNWASAQYNGATGAVSVVSANSQTLLITGVKLEIGSIATPFNFDSLAKRWIDCQRYYSFVSVYWSGNASATGAYYAAGFLPVTQRAGPTLSGVSTVASGFPTTLNLTGGGAAGTVVDSRVCSTTTTGAVFATTIYANAEL